jgi:predicted flavoprotein YhiN
VAADWDIVIVGAGTAGMPCAIEAAAAGTRVLVRHRGDRETLRQSLPLPVAEAAR